MRDSLHQMIEIVVGGSALVTCARRATWICLLVPGCFHPSYNHPACGPKGECPTGFTCNAQLICEDGVGLIDDAQLGDAQSSDAPTSDGSADCLAHWLDGTVAVSTPQELAPLSSAGSERDPWISPDGLTLYYGVRPVVGGTNDIYRASRSATDQPFGGATAVLNVNRSDADEIRAALTPDEKMLVLASNRATGSKFDVYLTTRTDTAIAFGSPDTRHLSNVNTGTASTFDPFLTADGLKLYLSPLPISSAQHIFVATRADINSDFSVPAQVPGLSSQSTDADPALSQDERIIVFSSTRNGGIGKTDLWYATRQNATDTFGIPKLIPTANDSADDGDPMLSADGCELYFSSTRNGGDYDLYVAQITP